MPGGTKSLLALEHLGGGDTQLGFFASLLFRVLTLNVKELCDHLQQSQPPPSSLLSVGSALATTSARTKQKNAFAHCTLWEQ